MNNLEKKLLPILYISYDGLLEPLGESQVLSYIESLSSKFDIDIISFEKASDLKTEKKEILKRTLEEKEIKWHCLKYHSRPSIIATMFDLISGLFVSIFIKNLSASFQKKITSILESKLILAMKYLKNNKIKISHISVVGGVAANKYIIEKLLLAAKKNHCTIVLPPKYMLSDNAAMIGWASINRYNLSPSSNLNFQANPRLKITNFIK